MKASKIIAIVLACTGASLNAVPAAADQGYLFIGFDDRGQQGIESRHDHHYWKSDYHRDGGYRDERMAVTIDRIQERQRDRIHEAWRNGDLTRLEMAQLRDQQRDIERLQRSYLEDGRLSSSERRHLLAELDQARHNIQREIFDRDAREHRWRHAYR